MNNVIIFPTDTVYGIAAKIDDPKAQSEIFKIKHRDQAKRLAVLCANIEQMKEIAYVSETAVKLINKYMPGGLTIILKTKEKYITDFVLETVALRIPNHKLALKILLENGPMSTTSVNLSNEPPINDFALISKMFSDKVDTIYENNEEISGVSSTVINLTTNNIECIREGNLKFDEILEFLNYNK